VSTAGPWRQALDVAVAECADGIPRTTANLAPDCWSVIHHHIALGRHPTGTRVLLLIADSDVRVIDAATGELYRHLTLNPDRLYHGTGRPPGPPPRKPQRPDP
jgi:hypothetical protein